MPTMAHEAAQVPSITTPPCTVCGLHPVTVTRTDLARATLAVHYYIDTYYVATGSSYGSCPRRLASAGGT